MFNVGTIIELEKNKALIMTPECDFVFIRKKPGMFIGQQVSFKDKETRKPQSKNTAIITRTVGIAALFMVILFAFFQFLKPGAGDNIYAYVDVDINPGIEFLLDERHKVVKAVPMNEDAQSVLRDLNMKGISLDSAVLAVIDESKDKGFLPKDKENAVLVAAALNAETAKDKTSLDTEKLKLQKAVKELENTIESSNKYNLKIKAVTVKPETKKEAARNHLTLGRQLIHEKALESKINLTMEEVRDGNIAELLEKVDIDKTTKQSNTNQPVKIKPSGNKVKPTPTKVPGAGVKPTVQGANPTVGPSPTFEKTVFEYMAPQVRGRVDGNRLVINWEPIHDPLLISYRVVISQNNGNPVYPQNGYLTEIRDKNKTSLTINNTLAYKNGDFGKYLVPGKRYYISVTAVYDGNVYLPGNSVSLVYPVDSSLKYKPNVRGRVVDGKVVLSWDPIQVEGFNYYKVVISKSDSTPRYPENGYLYAIGDKNASTVTIDNSEPYKGGDFGEFLMPGQRYYFSVTLVYNDKKVPGNVVALTYPGSSASQETTTAPKVTASVGSGRIVLKWQPAVGDGFVYYKVVISKNNPRPKYPEDGYLVYFTDRNVTQAVIDNSQGYNGGDFGGTLTPGEKYYFSVTTVMNSGKYPGNSLHLEFPK